MNYHISTIVCLHDVEEESKQRKCKVVKTVAGIIEDLAYTGGVNSQSWPGLEREGAGSGHQGVWEGKGEKPGSRHTR